MILPKLKKEFNLNTFETNYKYNYVNDRNLSNFFKKQTNKNHFYKLGIVLNYLNNL